MTGFASAQPWRECTRPRTSPGFSKVVDDAKLRVTLVGCVATARVGVPGAPEFVERHVISTWSVCWYCGGCREVRNTEFRTRLGRHPTAEFFLPSQFVLASGELGVGRPCCAAQADQDLSETPAPAREVVDNRRHECGRVGVWAKHRGMGFP